MNRLKLQINQWSIINHHQLNSIGGLLPVPPSSLSHLQCSTCPTKSAAAASFADSQLVWLEMGLPRGTSDFGLTPDEPWSSLTVCMRISICLSLYLMYLSDLSVVLGLFGVPRTIGVHHVCQKQRFMNGLMTTLGTFNNHVSLPWLSWTPAVQPATSQNNFIFAGTTNSDNCIVK